MGEFKAGDRVRVTPPEGRGEAYDAVVYDVIDCAVVLAAGSPWPRHVSSRWMTALPPTPRAHTWEVKGGGVRCVDCGYCVTHDAPAPCPGAEPPS